MARDILAEETFPRLMAFNLPLLHIARSVVTVTTVDGWAVALAVLAFIGWLAWTVRPWRASKRTQRHTLRVAAFVLAFLAVLPAVLPYDHLFVQHLAHDGDHAEAASEVHASHCHDTPGSCADAPVTAGPGQMLASGSLVPSPALLSVLLLLALPILLGVTWRPEVRPPLRAYVPS